MPGQFFLSELPDYKYPFNLACPDCYAPLPSANPKDGRCESCRKSKYVLPVNYVRPPKKKEEDEDEEFYYTSE